MIEEYDSNTDYKNLIPGKWNVPNGQIFGASDVFETENGFYFQIYHWLQKSGRSKSCLIYQILKNENDLFYIYKIPVSKLSP